MLSLFGSGSGRFPGRPFSAPYTMLPGAVKRQQGRFSMKLPNDFNQFY
jgi:hypothetical protein